MFLVRHLHHSQNLGHLVSGADQDREDTVRTKLETSFFC